jgi:hypothetical protein
MTALIRSGLNPLKRNMFTKQSRLEEPDYSCLASTQTHCINRVILLIAAVGTEGIFVSK